MIIYILALSGDVIPASRAIDEVIERHIGTLKVRDSDLEIMKLKTNIKISNRYNTPLARYLETLKKGGTKGAITSAQGRLFGLNYIISAETMENPDELDMWMNLQQYLANPEEFFDRCDKDTIYRVDREKTLREMEGLYGRLEASMPDNSAGLFIVEASSPTQETNIGIIALSKLKAKERTKIEEAKEGLVERLKEFEGPCLSFDAPSLIEQMVRLYFDAPRVVAQYGDILTDPNWKRRFFRLDP